MRRKLLALVLFVLLTSCNPVQWAENDTKSGSDTPVETISAPTYTPTIQKTTRAPFLTKTPTEPSFPTSAPSETPAAAPTSTEIPPVVWGDTLPIIHIPDHGINAWSPTANEILLSNNSTDVLYLAAAPDFIPVNVSQKMFDSHTSDSVIWSLDGQKIYFSGPRAGDEEGLTVESEYTTPWVVNRDGSDPHLLIEEDDTYHWLQFKGWLDQSTLCLWSYSGGGFSSIALVNAGTGERVAGAFYNGDLFEPSRDYMAAMVSEYLLNVFVITKQPQTNPFPDHIMGGYAKVIPIFQPGDFDKFYTGFIDWYPGTNKMLVERITNEGGFSTDLLIWNVETDAVTAFVPGGIGGSFSPDGRYLAYLIDRPLAPAGQEDAQTSSDINAFNFEVANPHVELLNLKTMEVDFSLPVETRFLWHINMHGYNPAISFSPKGRYIGVVSPGEIIVDAYGWPVGINRSEDETPYLHIIDLQNHKVVFGRENVSEPTWAPKEDKFLVTDENGNLTLVDLASKTEIAITQFVGDRNLSGV
jgi:hypothetical protein